MSWLTGLEKEITALKADNSELQIRLMAIEKKWEWHRLDIESISKLKTDSHKHFGNCGSPLSEAIRKAQDNSCQMDVDVAKKSDECDCPCHQHGLLIAMHPFRPCSCQHAKQEGK